MKKIVIAQYWTSNIAYGKYTKLITQRYCDLKGYEYYYETDDDKIKSIVGVSPVICLTLGGVVL